MIFWWSSGSSRGAWAASALIALFVGFFFSMFFGATSPFRILIFIMPVFFLVLPFILYVMQGGKKGQARSEAAPVEKEKPKRGESLAELMSILNDEDIDDLRARVKMRLEEQIDSADVDGIETFEELLDEKGKHKRGVR